VSGVRQSSPPRPQGRYEASGFRIRLSQVRNAVVSISTNIAEGYGREGDREVARFMVIAAGSASETVPETQRARRNTSYLRPDA